MPQPPEPIPGDTLRDYLSGRPVPNRGAEANRQAFLQFLVESKGYPPEALGTDIPLEVAIGGEVYRSHIDVLVRTPGRSIWALAVKCAAGSLGSWEREILAAARLVREDYQIPWSVVTDGRDAVMLDTAQGKVVGRGLGAIPGPRELERRMEKMGLTPYPAERREREKLIFRTYDVMNVNR